MLTTYKRRDILNNLKYVEKKIKEGTVNSIGAYTITAIKENYRLLPNLFDQEESDYQKARKEEERRQQVLLRLKQQYEEERDRQFEKHEKEYSTDTLNKLKKQATREVEQQQGENFPFLKLLSEKRFKNKLIEASGFPC